MEIWLRIECQACNKALMVNDAEVEDTELACPHCSEPAEVPQDDDDG